MTKDKNKVIYLKSLIRKFKPKETLPEDLKIEMAKLNIGVEGTVNKPVDPFADKKAGRKFILDNMDGFLEYCHGIGIKLTHLIQREMGTSYQTVQLLKQSLDPAGIMNPGKLSL